MPKSEPTVLGKNRLRIEEVLTFMVSGATRKQIIEHAKEENWGVTDRSIDFYMEQARAKFRGMAQPEQRQEELGKSVARLEMLFQSAYQIQDYKTCLSIQKALIDLWGLNQMLIPSAEGVGETEVIVLRTRRRGEL